MSVTVGLISTGLLLMCLLIHFKCHFTLNICGGFKNITNLVTPRQSSLAFYPSFWTIYVMYLCILSISIIILDVLDINNKMINWTICYGVILSSCWESLFSFHRYCTLKQYMNRSKKIKTKTILKKFTGFASIYILLFISQLHAIYWLFPFIIIMYVSFNILWQYQFIQMLLKQYSTLSTIDTVAASNIQDKMIKSVYIMGYCSISSTAISSLLVFSLSVFCPFDTNYYIHYFNDKMYNLVSTYFPFFWFCSSLFYMMNFVRNRAFFRIKFKNIGVCLSYLTELIETVKSHQIRQHSASSPSPSVPPCVLNNKSSSSHSMQSIQSIQPTQQSPESIPSVPSSPHHHHQSIKPIITGTALPALPQSSVVDYDQSITVAVERTDCKSTISILSDEEIMGKPSLCLAPPISVISTIKSSDHCGDDISSEDIEHDYNNKLIIEQHESNDISIPIHISVLRISPHSNISVITDSSGYISNSMISPKQILPTLSKREKTKSIESSSNNNNKCNNIQQQKSQKSHVLDEKTEFVVPLSVIEDARCNEEIKSIRIHRNNDDNINNMPNMATYINQNQSNSQNSQYSNDTNHLNEISYTQNTCNSVPKSSRLDAVRDSDQHSISASTVSKITISRINHNIKPEIHRFNKSTKCRSLPVTPQEAVDSASSPSSSMGHNRSYGPTKSVAMSTKTFPCDLIIGDLTLDNSASLSLPINGIHHGEHALSAPEEDIMNHYQSAIQQDIKEKVKNKSTGLMDMMVNYGWTDIALLNSLQNLRRFSR